MTPRRFLLGSRHAAAHHLKPVVSRALVLVARAIRPFVPPAPPAQLQSLEAVLRSTDEVILALARSGGLGRQAPPRAPLSLGDRVLWFEHPRAKFHLLDARDLHDTPAALAGSLRPHLHELLERLLDGVELAVEVGAHQGVHTLTIAQRLAGRGRLVVADPSPSSLTVARENLTAHRLQEGVAWFSLGEGGEQPSPFRDVGGALQAADLRGVPIDGWGLLKVDAALAPGEALERLIARAGPAPRVVVLDLAPTGASALRRLEERGLSVWRVHDEGRLELTSVAGLSALRHACDVLVASSAP